MSYDHKRLQALENTNREIAGAVEGLQSRLGQIGGQIGDLSVSVAGLTDRKSENASGSDWSRASAWAAIAQAFLTVVAIGASIGVAVYTNSVGDRLNAFGARLDTFNARLGEIENSQARFYTALKMFAGAVAPQKLLHELDDVLAGAVSESQSGNAQAAKTHLEAVAAQALLLKDAGVQADQRFFTRTAAALQTISRGKGLSAEAVAPALQSLTDYKSAVVVPSDLAEIFAPGSSEPLTIADIPKIPRDHDGYFKGFRVYLTEGQFKEPDGPFKGVQVYGDGSTILFCLGSGDLFVAGKDSTGRRPLDSVHNTLIIAQSQKLDGFDWENVVFLNVHVRYEGGAVRLKHVSFVHCTFEGPPIKGEPLLNYALSGQDYLDVKGE